ncbi:SOS response-associated peptidase [Marinicrinis sediminis]|uniref:Abasic site processing protein n=1 Tax=Marinicrinis sediminis TaxID=1652465 RepID=A0ABW5RCK1_9BACL
MCGRFTFTLSLEDLMAYLGVEQVQFDFEPRYNIAPTQKVIAAIEANRERRVGQLQWGLIPNWSKDERIGSKLINARSETIVQKPSFRMPFQRKRCLIPADGFYEWKRETDRKQPYRITLADRQIFSFAGLYDSWKHPDGYDVHTCTLLTTAPNETMETIHDRMPVILHRADEARWLSPALSDEERLSLLRPYTGAMEAYPVSTAVNSARYDHPDCIQPIG